MRIENQHRIGWITGPAGPTVTRHDFGSVIHDEQAGTISAGDGDMCLIVPFPPCEAGFRVPGDTWDASLQVTTGACDEAIVDGNAIATPLGFAPDYANEAPDDAPSLMVRMSVEHLANLVRYAEQVGAEMVSMGVSDEKPQSDQLANNAEEPVRCLVPTPSGVATAIIPTAPHENTVLMELEITESLRFTNTHSERVAKIKEKRRRTDIAWKASATKAAKKVAGRGTISPARPMK